MSLFVKEIVCEDFVYKTMRQKIKPELDLESIQRHLLEDIVNEYDRTSSINKTAKALGLSNMKVRKALITAGVYSNETSEDVERYLHNNMGVDEIAKTLKLSVSAVYSYIPYKITAYNLTEKSVDADRADRYRKRKNAIKALASAFINNMDWKDELWNTISLYQGQRFKTSGRGEKHNGAVGFTYLLKISGGTGKSTEEIIFSTREQGKTVTRSLVERAFGTAMDIQKKEGYVSGPKRLDTFGDSYLYAMFLRWGLISDKPSS